MAEAQNKQRESLNISFEAAVNTDPERTLDQVMDNPYCSNGNKLVATIAKAIGAKNGFKARIREGERGEWETHYPTKELCAEIAAAL